MQAVQQNCRCTTVAEPNASAIPSHLSKGLEMQSFLRSSQQRSTQSPSHPWKQASHCPYRVQCPIRQNHYPRSHAPTRTFTLENGLVLRHFTIEELNFLYREVFQDRVYLRHGVTIRPGDTVVDVGANTGLFTLLAAREVGPRGRVVALEPLTSTFELMKANVAAQAEWSAQRGQEVANPVLLNCGAGAPGQDSATFVTYANSASGWTTMYPDDGEVRHNMHRYIRHLLEGDEGAAAARQGIPEAAEAAVATADGHHQGQGDEVPEPGLARVARALWRRVPPLRPLLRAAVSLYVGLMLSGQQRWRCALAPLSVVIREQGLDRIDLLKVDVERAELDVLYGIAAADWPRVRQVVMEVHDLDGRLAAVREMLTSAGFSKVVSEQDARLAGSTLHLVYAVREE